MLQSQPSLLLCLHVRSYLASVFSSEMASFACSLQFRQVGDEFFQPCCVFQSFLFCFTFENVSAGYRVLGSQWLISVHYSCCSTVFRLAWFPGEICCHPILVRLWVLCLFFPLWYFWDFYLLIILSSLGMLWFVCSFIYVSWVYGSLNVLSLWMRSFENIWTRLIQTFPGPLSLFLQGPQWHVYPVPGHCSTVHGRSVHL